MSRYRAIRLVASALAAGAAALAALSWLAEPRVSLRLKDASPYDSADSGYGTWFELDSGVVRRVLFLHPPRMLGWTLRLPPGRHRFTAELGFRDEAFGRSDGVEFRVRRFVRGEEQTLARLAVVPDRERPWRPLELDLESDGGEQVLFLETGAGTAGNFDYDWALWSNPTIDCHDDRRAALLLASALGLALLVFAELRQGEARRLGRTVARAALVGAGLAGAIALAELALRRLPELAPKAVLDEAADAGLDYFPRHDAENLYEEELGYRHRPLHCWTYRPPRGLVESGEMPEAFASPPLPEVESCSDEDGFRNPPGRPPLAVAALGDSFTAAVAFPREATWPGLVERRLGKPVGNFGLSGYGPVQYLRVLETYVLPRAPRAVVVAFYEANDVDDSDQFLRFQASKVPWNRFLATLREWHFGSTVTPRYRRSLLGTLAARSAASFESRGLPGAVGPIAGDGFNPLRGEIAGRPIEVGMYGLALRRTSRSAEQLRASAGFAPTFEALAAMRDLCRSSGVPLLVVLLPSAESIYPALLADQIDPRTFERFVAARAPGDFVVTWEGYLAHRRDTDTVLVAELARTGIDVVSLFEPFEQAAARGEELFIPDDAHANAAGNALVAERVALELERRGLTRSP